MEASQAAEGSKGEGGAYSCPTAYLVHNLQCVSAFSAGLSCSCSCQEYDELMYVRGMGFEGGSRGTCFRILKRLLMFRRRAALQQRKRRVFIRQKLVTTTPKCLKTPKSQAVFYIQVQPKTPSKNGFVVRKGGAL